MAHTYAANFAHCIFSTKGRVNSIPKELQEKLWAYLVGIANNLHSKMIAVGGTANHIHLNGSADNDVRSRGGAEIKGEFFALDGRAGDRVPMARRIRRV